MADIIRVLRIIEYIGPRKAVEEQVAKSVHGERRLSHPEQDYLIRATTLGEFPDVLTAMPFVPKSMPYPGGTGPELPDCIRDLMVKHGKERDELWRKVISNADPR